MRIECITYSDADWDKEFDHVSVSGHVMQICTPSERDAVQNSPSGVEPTLPKYNVISWFSRKQRDHVAMSSEDAETTAAVPSGHLIQWARGLFDELHLISKTSPERPWLLMLDNSATVANLHSGKISSMNMHNARHHAYIRNLAGLGLILPWKVDTKLNKADPMTKVLPPKDHERHLLSVMGLYPNSEGQPDSVPFKKRRMSA
jgi:hypothetical protein